MKIYTKGERVLRVEVVVHNTEELGCGRVLIKFPHIVRELKGIRFPTAPIAPTVVLKITIRSQTDGKESFCSTIMNCQL
jgi:hypothetical protein